MVSKGLTMTRTHDDSWDLASSVGATATLVAAARAAASRQPHPIVDDPYAEPLVRAVGVDFFARMAGGLFEPDEDAPMGVSRMIRNMSVRTRFFDDFFRAASGIRQAVILAAGLDSRAYRLPWPSGTVLYEVDQSGVIEFKSATLDRLGAAPRCDRRTVAVDLRQDWAAALLAAGFDTGAPTAWSAEGLLSYLPPETQDGLLSTVTALSAPGSRIAIDCSPPSGPEEREASRLRMREIAGHWRERGFNLDFSELLIMAERNEAGDYLTGHGWRVNRTSINEMLADHRLPPFDDDEPMATLYYVDATLDGGTPTETRP